MRALALLTLLTALATPAAAFGQAPPAGAQPSPTGEDDEPEREGRPKAYAPDGRSGHVQIAAVSAAEFPAGDLAPGRALTDVVDVGASVGGSISVGVSRYLSLDASAKVGFLFPRNDCDSCEGRVVGAGLGLRYHLVQGSAFDPWIRLGMGYRLFEIEHDQAETARVLAVESGSYHGLDAAQLAFGGWFYPVRGFGLGPFMSTELGTFLDWPEGTPRVTRAYAFFQLGLAVVIDPVEWAAPTSNAFVAGGQPAPRF